MAGRIVVGTSSWADPGFIEDWYPRGMPAGERLSWYAERFEAVELNSSYYAIPQPDTVARWTRITPEGFTFDVKLHKLLSRHSATLDSLPEELREHARTTDRGRVLLTPELEGAMAREILTAVAPLIETGRLSSFLLQLTPAFGPKRNQLEELAPLIDHLRPHRVAVEFRNRGWVEEAQAELTFDFLSQQQAAFVSVDAPPGDHHSIMPAVDAVTSDHLAYMRMHGRNTEGYLKGRSVPERFGWDYSDAELEEIATRARGLAQEVPDLRVMFNNNRSAGAPTAARRFRELIGQDPGPPVEDAQLRLLGG